MVDGSKPASSPTFSKNKYADRLATDLYRSMPYEILKDDNGNYVPWNYRKSPTEVERLNNLGLLDETYNPLQDLSRYDIRSNSQYVRVQEASISNSRNSSTWM